MNNEYKIEYVLCDILNDYARLILDEPDRDVSMGIPGAMGRIIEKLEGMGYEIVATVNGYILK